MKRKKAKETNNSKDYLEFLQKRLKSKNYKKNVTAEEYIKTQIKYDKEKLKNKLLRANK